MADHSEPTRVLVLAGLLVAVVTCSAIAVKCLVLHRLPANLQTNTAWFLGTALSTLLVLSAIAQLTGYSLKDIVTSTTHMRSAAREAERTTVDEAGHGVASVASREKAETGPVPQPDLRALMPIDGAVTVEDVRYLDMNGNGIQEIVVVSHAPRDDVDIFAVDIVTWEHSQQSWRNSYHLEMVSPGCPFVLEEAELTEKGFVQLLVTAFQGSGHYLDYWLVGYNGLAKPVTLLHGESLFQGQAGILGKQLVVESGDQRWSYMWDGTEFLKSAAGFVPEPRGVVVNYWWEGDRAFSDAAEVVLHVGQTLYLRRDTARDQSKHACRRLLSAKPGIYECTTGPALSGIVAKARGTVHISVIPGGYGLEGVEWLSVHVEIT